MLKEKKNKVGRKKKSRIFCYMRTSKIKTKLVHAATTTTKFFHFHKMHTLFNVIRMAKYLQVQGDESVNEALAKIWM